MLQVVATSYRQAALKMSVLLSATATWDQCQSIYLMHLNEFVSHLALKKMIVGMLIIFFLLPVDCLEDA